MTRNIPDTEHSSVARFLESQGLKEEALAVTKDSDQKFDLALELEKLDIAHELMTQLKETDKDTTEANSKWKRLGDLALSRGNLELSEKCAEASGDMAGLLLLYTSTGNYEGTVQLCEKVRSLWHPCIGAPAPGSTVEVVCHSGTSAASTRGAASAKLGRGTASG